MPPVKPFRITASAAAPSPAKREPWFAIKALGLPETKEAELRLRGYIGESSTYSDYYTGEEKPSGGAGTLQEFEAALQALGDVDVLHLYITSQGGDFPTAIAISSILARQKARIVCTIDGYAYSAAPVIACAADEVRAASNALLMIHDAEFWCAGSDVEALEKHIQTLNACNDSMAAAFVNKAGGTADEWMSRMKATTWMTGKQAADLKIVDVLLDEVALSAYAPLKNVTAALSAPAEIRALIDKAPPAVAPTQTPTPPITAMLRPRSPLLTAAAEVPPAGGAPEAAPVVPPVAAPAAPITLEAITAAVSGALKPLEEKITAQAERIKHLEGIGSHGVPAVTASSPSPVSQAQNPKTQGQHDVTKMTAAELINLGRSRIQGSGAAALNPALA